MTPDEFGFRRAIACNPTDLLPRQVYADWLDDDGRYAHARYIREGVAGQHAMTCYAEGVPADVLTEDGAFRLAPPLPGIAYRVNVGCVEGVACHIDAWLTWSGYLANMHPLCPRLMDVHGLHPDAGLFEHDERPGEYLDAYFWYRGMNPSHGEAGLPVHVWNLLPAADFWGFFGFSHGFILYTSVDAAREAAHAALIASVRVPGVVSDHYRWELARHEGAK